jgi:hypothetical protein
MAQVDVGLLPLTALIPHRGAEQCAVLRSMEGEGAGRLFSAVERAQVCLCSVLASCFASCVGAVCSLLYVRPAYARRPRSAWHPS